MPMSSAVNDNTQFVTRYLETLSGQAKPVDLVARFVSDPDLVEHIRQVEAAFPKYELLIEEIVGERDLVVVRGLFRGVQQGPFAGIEPTGIAASAGLMIMYRIQDGRIAQHWLQFDMAGLLAQLQADVPAAAPQPV